MSLENRLNSLEKKLEQELRRKTKVNVQQNDVLTDHKKQIAKLKEVLSIIVKYSYITVEKREKLLEDLENLKLKNKNIRRK